MTIWNEKKNWPLWYSNERSHIANSLGKNYSRNPFSMGFVYYNSRGIPNTQKVVATDGFYGLLRLSYCIGDTYHT